MHGTFLPDFSTEAFQYLLIASTILGVLGGIFFARARINAWLPMYAVSSILLGIWVANFACGETRNFNCSAFFGSPFGFIFAMIVAGMVMIVAGVSWAISAWAIRGLMYLMSR